MKIAALYARVSTAGQEKEETILSQIAEIETSAAKDNISIGSNLRFVDEGWTGELLARPGLDALRDGIKNKLFETVFVYDLGRLSRNFLNQMILKNEISEAGIQLISLHDVNGDTPEQLLAQNVMGLFHEYERIKIVERMRRGKLYKTKNGILFGWQAPYGYKYIKGKDKCTGYFKVVPYEAEVIKKIFQWVGVEGLTIRQVIKRMYDLKMYPRQSSNSYWSTSTLSKRLRDESYIGIIYYNKTQSVIPKNPHKNEKYKRIKKSSRKMKDREDWFAINIPPIIDKELFKAVQKQLVLNDTYAMRNKKNEYLLSGVAYCTCGRKRTGEGNSKTHNVYYRCTDRVLRYPLPKQCMQKGVNGTVLDTQVWDTVVKLLSNRKLIEQQFEIWKQNQIQPSENTELIKKELKEQLDQFEEQEKRFLTAYGEGAISLEQYKDKSKEIMRKKANIMTRLTPPETDMPSQPALVLPDLEEFCKRMKAILSNRSFEKKLPIVRKVINKVTTDGTIARVQGQIPLEIPEETTKEYVGFKTQYRYRRTPQRG